ncbi:MAG: VOC family protein [Syntrophobacteraceae bacterium]|nr:VOC family protein [Syntrophobacteraceae bacterium]
MEKVSPAKIKCKGINQVAIVVENLELVAENYWNIMGIGPWAVFNWEAPLVYDRKYRGETVWAREKIALAQVGGVQLELVQPVEGPSIYGDWLRENGEGLHHMNFLVDDVDETVKVLESNGFPSLQSGKFGPVEMRGAYNYIRIDPLHAIWEPVHYEEIGAEPVMIPAGGKESGAKIKCRGINQIAIVVKDLESVAQNYWNILGIGPWAVFNWEAPLVYERKYRGEAAWAREKIALAQVGDVQLELVQPVDGPSIYADWIKGHGEGLHHMNFLVDDVDRTAEILEKEGFKSLQSGKFGPPEKRGAYNYFDIKPLRSIWEPVYYEEVGAEPVMIPAV